MTSAAVPRVRFVHGGRPPRRQAETRAGAAAEAVAAVGVVAAARVVRAEHAGGERRCEREERDGGGDSTRHDPSQPERPSRFKRPAARATRCCYRRRVRTSVTLLVVALATGCAGQNSVGSIGAVLGRDNDTHALHVRDVPKGLAADEAGLLPGDEIVMIDGFYARDLGPKELHALLRGEVGSAIELTILRGEEVRRVVLRRTPLRTGVEPARREEKLSE